jgi:predicted amidohydrolase
MMIIRGGHVVDHASGIDRVCDVRVENGKILSVGEESVSEKNTEEINAEGKFVFPGLVDSHVHISADPAGFIMLAKAGVTTALDMKGFSGEFFKNAEISGAGLTAGFLYPLIPGRTVSSESPSAREIEKTVAGALSEGAFGLKIIGGHYPLTPDSIYEAIKTADKLNCYCAVHVGSTENGSNISGLKELMELRGGMPSHIAHVNSYCRGQIEDPVKEAEKAIKLLCEAQNIQSESYLSPINGTSGKFVDGKPMSHVTRTCLSLKNYPLRPEGLKKAILDGWALVNGKNSEEEIVLLSPEEGLEFYNWKSGNVYISFPVNSPEVASKLALSRKNNGKFVVDALSTDGGVIPRNTTLEYGLRLVEAGKLGLKDFIQKASYNPAEMLGLKSKGSLLPGSDADIVIVDRYSKIAENVFCRGAQVVKDGRFYGGKKCISLHSERAFS